MWTRHRSGRPHAQRGPLAVPRRRRSCGAAGLARGGAAGRASIGRGVRPRPGILWGRCGAGSCGWQPGGGDHVGRRGAGRRAIAKGTASWARASVGGSATASGRSPTTARTGGAEFRREGFGLRRGPGAVQRSRRSATMVPAGWPGPASLNPSLAYRPRAGFPSSTLRLMRSSPRSAARPSASPMSREPIPFPR